MYVSNKGKVHGTVEKTYMCCCCCKLFSRADVARKPHKTLYVCIPCFNEHKKDNAVIYETKSGKQIKVV